MKTRIWLIVATFLLQIGIGLLPLLPFMDELTPADSTATIVLFIGIHLAVFSGFIGVLFLLEKSDVDTISKLLKVSNFRGEVRNLRDDEFYTQFLRLASKAESHVCISYFAPYPPSDIGNTQRNDYYASIKSTIHRRRDVSFRRIVRNSSGNQSWICELINSAKGKSNASIALLEDCGDEEMPLALSIQIVDDEYAWLVAVGTHERTDAYRDLFIEDSLIAQMLSKYHGRIWDKSVVAVSNGRITEEGKAMLEQQGGGQQ